MNVKDISEVFLTKLQKHETQGRRHFIIFAEISPTNQAKMFFLTKTRPILCLSLWNQVYFVNFSGKKNNIYCFNMSNFSILCWIFSGNYENLKGRVAEANKLFAHLIKSSITSFSEKIFTFVQLLQEY